MQLYEMLYKRLTDDETLAGQLATFNERPAVFYQRAPSADRPGWGGKQYPRVDYIVDLQENPARNTSGTLMLNIWCDIETDIEPESIERQIRALLHASFVQADDFPYSFSWVRSDAFEKDSANEQSARIIGATMIFDIMAFPSQCAASPDPARAINEWTKDIIPGSIVIGTDALSGWIVPTKETPVIYWGITTQSIDRQTYACTWLNVGLSMHVFSPEPLHYLRCICNALALSHCIMCDDGSPMFIKSFNMNMNDSALKQGQVSVSAQYGVLNMPTDVPKLEHINVR